MTTPTALPIRDAITGEPVTVWPHGPAHPDNGGGHYVLMNAGTGGADCWLTPTAALQLAHALLSAAEAITARADQ